MQVSIPVKSLLEQYRNGATSKYLCVHINKILDNDLFDVAVCSNAVKKLLTKYFTLTDTHYLANSAGTWFVFVRVSFGPNRYFIKTITGEEIECPHAHNTMTVLRIMLLEYVLKYEPEAVITFELERK